MALKMSKELDNGFTAEYWKITKIDFNVLNEVSFVELSLYKDAAARTSGKDRVLAKTYSWNGDDYPFSSDAMDNDNPITIAYTKIKTLDEFSTAIDV